MLLLNEPSIPRYAPRYIEFMQDLRAGIESPCDPCFDDDDDITGAQETFVTRRQAKRMLQWVHNSIFVVYRALLTGQRKVETSDPMIQYSMTDALLYCAQAAGRVQAASTLFPDIQDMLSHVCVPLRDAYRVSCMADDDDMRPSDATKTMKQHVEDAIDALVIPKVAP